METNYEFPVTKVKKTRIWGRDKEWPELHEFTSDHDENHRKRFARNSSTRPPFRISEILFWNLEISRTDESERTHKLKTPY